MTKTRETMIAELGRRHPAAADDVDAILAMPRSDAVNEGPLALAVELEKWHCCAGSTQDLMNRAAAALRAVPSPDTEALQRVLREARRFADPDGDPTALSARVLISQIDAALSPSHCTAGRREEMIRRIELVRAFIASEYADPAQEPKGDWISPEARPAHDALCLCLAALAALASEQSGPIAGREALAYHYGDSNRYVSTPSPPDRQQDQGKTSVLPRGASAEPVAWLVLSEETGNTRLWSRSKDIAEAFAAKNKLNCIPLYASPPVSDASREAMADLKSHYSAWRSIMDDARETASDDRDDMDEKGWIAHEITALDRVFAALANSFDKTGDDVRRSIKWILG